MAWELQGIIWGTPETLFDLKTIAQGPRVLLGAFHSLQQGTSLCGWLFTMQTLIKINILVIYLFMDIGFLHFLFLITWDNMYIIGI